MIVFRLTEHTRLGDRFELVGRLGCGAFGEVWRARRLSDGQLVALKIPHDQDIGAETLRKEPALLRQLNHENVVRMFGWHMLGGLFVIELELIEGQTLGSLLKQERSARAPDMERMLGWSAQILSGLRYIHAQGIVHGDIKPQNVLIDTRDIVRLIDFGVSYSMDDLLESSTGAGTWLYMAPEVAAGRPARNSDLYSVGVVMYRMLTGALPYRTPLEAWTAPRPPRPRELNPQISLALERSILRAMAPDPEWHYPSAEQMLEDVEYARRLYVHAHPSLPAR
jgi:serine/threonine-protein kinase